MPFLVLPDGQTPTQPGASLVQSGLSLPAARQLAGQNYTYPQSGTVPPGGCLGEDGLPTPCPDGGGPFGTPSPVPGAPIPPSGGTGPYVVFKGATGACYVGNALFPGHNSNDPVCTDQGHNLPPGFPSNAIPIQGSMTIPVALALCAAGQGPTAPITIPITPIGEPPIGEPPPISCPPTTCPPCDQPPPHPRPAPVPCDPRCNLDTVPPPSFGRVGSEAWCVAIDDIRRIVVGLGKTITDAAQKDLADLGKPTTQPTWVATVESMIGTLSLGGVATGLTGLAFALDQVWPGIRCQVQSGIICFTRVVAALSPCPANDLLAVGVVKAVLRLMDKMRAGTDAAVWWTMDISLHLDPLEQVVDYLMQSLCPTDVPSVPEAIECYLRGTITERQFECWLLIRGADPDVWKPVITARRERLTTDETIQLGYREDWPVDKFAEELRSLGWLNPQEIGARLELHWEVPTIADHLLWMSRNVGDPAYVEQYGLMEGFEERFWNKYSHDLTVQGMRKEVAQDHYAAHWLRPSPGQLQEFVYRLRPDKPGVQHPFTVKDYVNTLTEKEVVLFDRERFAETIFRVPALTYVREMFRNYTVGEDYLKSIHQDLGYSPSDSDNFVKVDKLDRARIRATEAHGWNPQAIAHGFVSGALDQDQVYALMRRMGFTELESADLMQRAQSDLAYTAFTRARSRTIFAALGEIKACLSVGVCDANTARNQLTSLGWDLSFAESWVAIQLSSANIAVIRQAVSRVRSAYLSGETDDIGTVRALTSLGIVPDAVQRYLTVWSLQRTPKVKRAERSEIVKHVCQGDMSTEEAIARLRAMKYPDADIRLYLADAQGCIAKRQQKAQAEIQKQNAMRAKQLDQLRKQALQQSKELLREMKRAEPPAKLQKWAAIGYITAQHFYDRMHVYGYPDTDINHFWDEASKKKGSVIQEGQTSGLHYSGSANGSGGPLV